MTRPPHGKQQQPAKAKGSTWRSLPTEARHRESARLDELEAEAVVSLLIREDLRGLQTAERAAPRIAVAAAWFAETLEADGDVVFAGAGTSGRLGVLEAAECPPTFGTDPRRIRAFMAGGSEAVFRSREGAEDRTEDGRRAAGELEAGDLLVALSASSVTPFALAALEEARSRGARTILLTCAAPAAFERPHDTPADLVIALDTGPEILTGSTRLKAGSATKAALNAITTTAMVLLGKVYGNWMVDLQPGSSKLKDRAIRIIESAGGVSPAEASRLYRQAGGEVKTAILMARLGVSAEKARRRLAAASGRLRRALGK